MTSRVNPKPLILAFGSLYKANKSNSLVTTAFTALPTGTSSLVLSKTYFPPLKDNPRFTPSHICLESPYLKKNADPSNPDFFPVVST